MPIDLDRGVIQRRHPDGFLIGMYADSPGVYFDENGEELPESDAARAGFPVDEHAVEREIREKLAAAEEKIRRDAATTRERAKAEALGHTPEANDAFEWAKERGINVQHLGAGRYQLEGPQGELLAEAKLTRGQAAKFLTELMQKERAAQA